MAKPSSQYRQPSLFNVEPENPQPEKHPQNPQALPPNPKPTRIDAFDLVDTVQSPIITFGWSWADMIAPRMRAIVPFSRMKALMEREQLASYTECSIYISSRAFEAPLDSDWTEIFVHVTCTVMETFFQEDYWETLKAPRKLSDWQTTQLNDLRHHIYDKRRDELKKRLKQSRAADKPTQADPSSETAPLQKSLF